MARITDITLLHQPELHTLTIRRTIRFMEEYAGFAGYAFGRITSYLEFLGELPADAPFVCFHNMDMEALDVELGFPVAEGIGGKDDIAASVIPAGRYVAAIDQGPYEQQDPTLEAIFAWIQANGHEMTGEIYYQYLNSTDRPTSELLTRMTVPVK